MLPQLPAVLESVSQSQALLMPCLRSLGRCSMSGQGQAWGRTVTQQGPITAAGETIPMEFIAMVTAAEEGPIGVEASLLTGCPHLALIHIWR